MCGCADWLTGREFLWDLIGFKVVVIPKGTLHRCADVRICRCADVRIGCQEG